VFRKVEVVISALCAIVVTFWTVSGLLACPAACVMRREVIELCEITCWGPGSGYQGVFGKS